MLKQVETYSGGVWSVTEERKFVWAGWLLLMELDGDNNIVRKYTWGLDLAGQNGTANSLEAAGGIGGLLAVEQPQTVGDPLKYVYFYDANGNVGQLADWAHDANDPGGAIVSKYEYDSYGGVIAQSGLVRGCQRVPL